MDVHRAHELKLLSYEIPFAKEARDWFELPRKAPRLLIRDELGIAVWCLWRSSFTDGDTVRFCLKGNRFFGDGKYKIGKTYWTKAAKFIQFITTSQLILGIF